VPTEYIAQPKVAIAKLRADGYHIMALEQSPRAFILPDVTPPAKVALLLGEEVHGIDSALLEQADTIIEIPMFGTKESFNVSVAAGIAIYELSKSKK
jgi:23S rRNA (guanosine2251-2'-O)-methyltransferase